MVCVRSGNTVTVVIRTSADQIIVPGWGTVSLTTLPLKFRPNLEVMQFTKLRNPANANSIDCAIIIGLDGIVLLKNYNSGDNFTGTEIYATINYSTSNWFYFDEKISGWSKTLLYDGAKIQSTTVIPGLGSLDDWDAVIFITRANVIEDTYEDIFIPVGGNTPYVQFTHFCTGSDTFLSTMKVWSGDRDVLGISVYWSYVSWSLGIIKIVGLKFKK